MNSQRNPPVTQSYLVDNDEATGQFSNWTSFAAPQRVIGPSIATHVQGISPKAGG